MATPEENEAKRMEAQLKLWRAQLQELVAKANTAGAKINVEYRERLEDFEVKHKAVQMKLEELKAAGAEKWRTLKAGLDAAWKDLESAFAGLTRG